VNIAMFLPFRESPLPRRRRSQSCLSVVR